MGHTLGAGGSLYMEGQRSDMGPREGVGCLGGRGQLQGWFSFINALYMLMTLTMSLVCKLPLPLRHVLVVRFV